MPTPEEKILNQLQGAPRINPASARLFTDWTLEPGDVVTVRSTEGDSVRNYQLPIYSMDFNWNGSPMMEISSSGNPEREPLPELVRKEYAEATSIRGMGRRIADVEEEVEQQYQTWQTKTDKLIGDYAKITGVKLDAEGNVVYEDEDQTIPVFDPTSPYSLYAKHEVTAQNIVDYVGLTGIKFGPDGKPIYKQATDAQGNPVWETDEQGNYVLDDEGNRIPVPATDSQGNPIPDLEADGHSMYSQISQSIDSIDSVVSGHTGAITRIEQKADRVISEVTAARNGETTLSSRIAQLATEITSKVSQTDLNTTLTGYVTTTALGTTIGAVKDEDGNITAASITAAINDEDSAAYINADHVYVTGTTLLSGQVTVNDGMFYVLTSLGVGNAANGGDIVSINNGKVSASTYDVKISGKVNFVVDNKTHYELTAAKVQNLVTGFGTTARIGQTISIPYSTISKPDIGANSPKIDLTVPDAIATIVVDNNPPAGKIGFKYTTLSNSTAVAVNFNIADTQAYKDGVSAAQATGRGEVFLSNAVYGEVTEQNGQYYLPFTYSLVYSTPTEQEPNATTIVQRNLTAYPTGFNAIRNAIYNSVTMSGSWNTVQALGAGRTLTVSSSNSAQDIVKDLTLSMGSWLSSGTRQVSLMDGNSAVALVNVSAPSLSGSWPDDSTGTNAGATNTYHVSQKDGSTTVGVGHSLALEITQASATDFTFDAANQRYTFMTTATVSDGNTVVLKGSYGTSQNPLTHSATQAVNYGRSLVTIDQDTSWSNGSLTVKTAGRTNASGTAEQSTRIISLSQGTESLSDAVFTVPVLDGNNTWTGFSVVVDASDLVTPAQVINVNKGQWVYNAETQDSTQITFSPSSGSGSAQTLTLTMGERTASWSTTHKKRIDVFDGFTQTSATRTGVSFLVDASDQYYLGKSTVGLSDTGWTNGSRTIGTSGRTDASGTESNASRTIQISVPSSDFSITSSYDSQSEHITITASAVAKDVANNGNITVATGTSADVERAISVSSITLGKSFSRSSAGGQPLSHSGSVSISRSSGGVVNFGSISTVTAEVTSCSVPVVLQSPSASLTWDSTNHVYTYTTSASVAVDGTNDALTRSAAGPLTPTDAINHGRTLVSLNDMTWNPVTGSSYPASRTIIAKTSGRTNASGGADEITKTLLVTPYLSFSGTNIYAWLKAGDSPIDIARVSGTISVTGASVTSSQVAYNKTNRTARGQVTGTISGTVNNTTFSKTFTLNNVNFDWAYQAGLDGTTYRARDYEFEDSGTDWSDEYPLDLSAVYQQGVTDASTTPGPGDDFAYDGKIDTSKHGNGGSVNLRASSSTSSARLTTIPNNAIIRTKVNLGTTPNQSTAYYSAEWVEVYYDGFSGYVQAQYVLNTLKYWEGGSTSSDYIIGAYSSASNTTGRNIVVYYTFSNSQSDQFTLKASQAAVINNPSTTTNYESSSNQIREVYSDDYYVVGKTVTLVWNSGSTRSFTVVGD